MTILKEAKRSSAKKGGTKAVRRKEKHSEQNVKRSSLGGKLKHRVSEVVLKNGARGLLIDVPDATVWEFEFQFRAGHRLTRSDKIYQTAHVMEHSVYC